MDREQYIFLNPEGIAGALMTCVEKKGGRCIRFEPTVGAPCITESPPHPKVTKKRAKRRPTAKKPPKKPPARRPSRKAYVPVEESARDLLSFAERDYFKKPEMAGYKREDVLKLARKIASLSKSDEVRAEHMAEAIQYGGHQSLLVGNTVWHLLMDAEGKTITKKQLENEFRERSLPMYDRMEEVFGLDVKPLIVRQVEYVNKVAKAPGMDTHEVILDLWQRQAKRGFLRPPAKARPPIQPGRIPVPKVTPTKAEKPAVAKPLPRDPEQMGYMFMMRPTGKPPPFEAWEKKNPPRIDNPDEVIPRRRGWQIYLVPVGRKKGKGFDLKRVLGKSLAMPGLGSYSFFLHRAVEKPVKGGPKKPPWRVSESSTGRALPASMGLTMKEAIENAEQSTQKTSHEEMHGFISKLRCTMDYPHIRAMKKQLRPNGKETWQMSQSNFVAAVRAGRDFPQLGVKPTPLKTLRAAKDFKRLDRQARQFHEAETTIAHAEGKPVPRKVLAAYPDLGGLAGLAGDILTCDEWQLVGKGKIIRCKGFKATCRLMGEKFVTVPKVPAQPLKIPKALDYLAKQAERYKQDVFADRMYKKTFTEKGDALTAAEVKTFKSAQSVEAWKHREFTPAERRLYDKYGLEHIDLVSGRVIVQAHGFRDLAHFWDVARGTEAPKKPTAIPPELQPLAVVAGKYKTYSDVVDVAVSKEYRRLDPSSVASVVTVIAQRGYGGGDPRQVERVMKEFWAASRAQPKPSARKEPWQMTREEWQAAMFAAKTPYTEQKLTRATASEEARRVAEIERLGYGASMWDAGKEVFFTDHIDVVAKAISEGKKIPPDVMANYPGVASYARGVYLKQVERTEAVKVEMAKGAKTSRELTKERQQARAEGFRTDIEQYFKDITGTKASAVALYEHVFGKKPTSTMQTLDLLDIIHALGYKDVTDYQYAYHYPDREVKRVEIPPWNAILYSNGTIRFSYKASLQTAKSIPKDARELAAKKLMPSGYVTIPARLKKAFKPTELVGPKLPLDKDEMKVVKAIKAETLHIDEIARRTGLAPRDVSSALVMLELKDLVQQTAGSMFHLKRQAQAKQIGAYWILKHRGTMKLDMLDAARMEQAGKYRESVYVGASFGDTIFKVYGWDETDAKRQVVKAVKSAQKWRTERGAGPKGQLHYYAPGTRRKAADPLIHTPTMDKKHLDAYNRAYKAGLISGVEGINLVNLVNAIYGGTKIFVAAKGGF